MPSLSVSVLGPLHVALADAPVAAVGYSKVRALLAYLAVEAGRPHPRAELCALLWPDRPEAAARRNLTQALTALRRTLGEAWLLAGPEVVRLNPERDLIVDAARFGALLDTAERHAHRSWPTCRPCADRLEAALALYRGDFLAQFFLPDSAPFEEWALLWRERLRQRAFSALERLAQRAEWCGAFSQAAAYAQRLAALDPLREASQREAMRLLALDGQLAAAEAQYEHLRRTLADELAVQPEPETRRLHERLRAGPPAALRRLAAPPVNGPLPPNALVGRAADVPAVCAQLRADGVRALTITGPPGLGKTRLALEAAQALRFDFEDGVHVVELAPAADAEQVLPAIAQVLGVKEPANGGALAAALSAWLQPRQVLLVLDNFEHVLAAAARVADLLAAGPGLKVLVTSRAPLRLRAEQQYALAPLPAADAVRLFGERARAVQPAFALTAANADALAELCARVDHLPLAIELLAGRARTFSPAELLRQLEQPLDALAHGARDLPARHRSLREALSWSYDRLTAEEQRALAHLGVFVGGWTAEAALSVAGAAPAILEALSEASLVQAEAPAEETRFGLLETVREFALEQLAARGAAPEARQRHAAYYLRLAERARPELDGPDQVRWFDRLEREHANLRAALAWGLAHDRALGLGLAWAAARFWSVRGYLGEGRRWLQELLQPGAAVPPGLEARALAAASRLASLQGEYRAALELAGRSEAVSLRQEDAGGVALAGLAAGVAHNGLGEYGTAQARLEASRALFEAEADQAGLAEALNALSHVAHRQGDYAAARALSGRALDLYRALQDPRNTAGLSLNLGVAAFEQGDYATARHLTEASLAVFRQLRDTNGLATALLNLGNTLLDTGELEAARGCFEEAIGLERRLGGGSVATPLGALGRVLRRLGDLTGAQACFAESLRLRLAAGERRGIAVTLTNCAHVEHALGRPDRAARLLGAAEALRQAIGAPLNPGRRAEYDQLVAEVRAALGEAELGTAWTAGRALSVEQAVALALEPAGR